MQFTKIKSLVSLLNKVERKGNCISEEMLQREVISNVTFLLYIAHFKGLYNSLDCSLYHFTVKEDWNFLLNTQG